MRAILKLKSTHKFAQYNGLTFDVIDIFDNMLALDIPELNNMFSNFSFKEVLIIDIINECKLAFKEKSLDDTKYIIFNDKHLGTKTSLLHKYLFNYVTVNNITIPPYTLADC